MKISVFENAMSKKPIQTISLHELAAIVRNPDIGGKLYIKAAGIVEKIRNLTNEDRQKELKLTLPAISPGTEYGINRQDIITSSGLMQIDIDHVDNPEQLRDALGKLSWVSFSALSVRKGVWLLVRIPEPARQPEYWEKVNAWLLSNYGIEADPKRKNPKDLRFYAPDVDAVYNPDAKVLPLLPPLPIAHRVIPYNYATMANRGFYFSPIDDFNSRADVIQMLTSNGWRIHSKHGGNIRFTRPGKRSGISANWNEELRKLYVFTSNSDLIQSDNRYPLSATDLFMQMNHIDCIAVARKQLMDVGYGQIKR